MEDSNSNEKSDELERKIKSLEELNTQMKNEFNVQRAKLKDLFLHKETEHIKCMENAAKSQEEIKALNKMVQETNQQSTIYKAELERNKEETKRLCEENRELRELKQKSESTNVFNFKKSLARTLGGEIFGSFDETTEQTENQYAQEDAEVLQAVVVQLQVEMKALKEKLREADDIHTKHLQSNGSVSANCPSCQIHEKKINDLLINSTEDKEKIVNLQKSLAESYEDLQKEAVLRNDLDNQWQKKREAHKIEVQLLREQVNLIEKQMLSLQQKFLGTKDEIMRELQQIIDERERCNKQLETLQADNDFLSGRYLKTAEEIESQYINLPNTVVELQELILRQQSELIQARVGNEFQNQKCVTSLDEIQLLRAQLDGINIEQRTFKKKVKVDMKSLQDRLTENMLQQQNYETTKASHERKEAELNRQISDFRVEIIELQDANEKLSKINGDYRAKIKNLQDDLATSEQVQKDFVKLSQRLQIALENLRHADTEVRWQDDEDIDNCSSCNLQFTVTVRKRHCRHCGRIYCDNCLTKTVACGPRKRLAKVCDICHTLLTPNTAPYFSHEQPQ